MGRHGGHDDFGKGHGRHGGGRHFERLFERFDANDDGVITEAEIEEVRSQSFASADADGSGDISLEEARAEFLTRSNDRMVRAFQFIDKDGDGSVSQQEADQAANRMFNMLDRDGNGTVEQVRGQRGPGAEDDERGRRGSGHRYGGHGGRMFLGMFDTDADGKVSREDFDARRGELFALADTDGDGSFSLDDFGPLWLEINEGRIVSMFQRADADGSLGITAEEHGKRLDGLMEHADRNKDGVITKADFKGGKNKGKGGHKHHRDHHRG
ncbi:calcium-binding protein [Roseibium salinum]|nr:calcium-binding protein [Roseibium sp. DSM 29163]